MALSYALYEIARNPTVQQQLQAEIDAFGLDREPSYEDLSAFPYTEAVFQEGMRLHPPVTPFIALVSFMCIHILAKDVHHCSMLACVACADAFFQIWPMKEARYYCSDSFMSFCAFSHGANMLSMA